MLYEPYETEISQGVLSSVLAALKSPSCLLGGWAVYLTVNTAFYARHGRNYIGSRDIDLGFHLDADASCNEINTSDFASALRILESQQFELISYRLLKHYDVQTRNPLSREEARKKHSHEMFALYVDLIVDNIPKPARETVGFTPIDEPLLSYVFERNARSAVEDSRCKHTTPLSRDSYRH